VCAAIHAITKSFRLLCGDAGTFRLYAWLATKPND